MSWKSNFLRPPSSRKLIFGSLVFFWRRRDIYFKWMVLSSRKRRNEMPTHATEMYVNRAGKRAQLYEYLKDFIELTPRQAKKICDQVRQIQGD